MNHTAESYVRLVLALGRHDPDYVDAYYGPPEWREAAEADSLPLDTIQARARVLQSELAAASIPSSDTLAVLRHEYLSKQLRALDARLEFLAGKKLPFDEESQLLYDAVAPTLREDHFKEVLARLDRELPGRGPVPARFQAYRARFVIPARASTPYSAPLSPSVVRAPSGTSSFHRKRASRSST